MPISVKYILVLICSYMLGNVLFGRILSSKVLKDDITKKGSGNPGTTNMLRNHGVFFGILTLILDGAKGAIASVSAFFIFGGYAAGNAAITASYAAGLAAVLGHMFPVVFKFKGGKGVATACGIGFMVEPLVTGVCLAVYFILLFVFKIGSLASLICALGWMVSATVLTVLDKNWISLALLLTIIILIFVAHRSNIKRLFTKKEGKIFISESIKKDAEHFQHLKIKKIQKKIKVLQKKRTVANKQGDVEEVAKIDAKLVELQESLKPKVEEPKVIEENTTEVKIEKQEENSKDKK